MAVGKRKAKRQLRAASEGNDAIEEVMLILRMAGVNIDFAWQVPDVVRQLVGQAPTGNAGFGHSQVGIAPPPPRALPGPAPGRVPAPLPAAVPNHAAAHRSPAAAVQAMAGVGQVPGRVPVQARPQAVRPQRPVGPQAAGRTTDELPLDPSIVGDLFADDEFGEPDPGPGEAAPDLSHMMAEVEAGQARMMNRVATNGVQYGNGMAGPAEGRRLVPHPSTPKRLVHATAPAPTEDEIEGMDLGVPGFGEEVDAGAGSYPGDERIDPKTGQSLGEKRRIMESILGKPMNPPTPGAPNTGVQMGGPRRG